MFFFLYILLAPKCYALDVDMDVAMCENGLTYHNYYMKGRISHSNSMYSEHVEQDGNATTSSMMEENSSQNMTSSSLQGLAQRRNHHTAHPKMNLDLDVEFDPLGPHWEEQFGRVHWKFECVDLPLASYPWSKISGRTYGIIDAVAKLWPDSALSPYVSQRPEYIVSATCRGLATVINEDPTNWDQDKATKACRLCLLYIRQRLVLELCRFKQGGRYASTHCAMTFQYFIRKDGCQSCPAPWPPEWFQNL